VIPPPNRVDRARVIFEQGGTAAVVELHVDQARGIKSRQPSPRPGFHLCPLPFRKGDAVRGAAACGAAALATVPELTVQEGEVDRLGGSAPVRVDVRVVATTNRDVLAAVQAGRFREDLYYRLNVFPITVPPLRKRKADIRPLAEHFLAIFAKKLGKPQTKIPEEEMKNLMEYDWPGNVRELENKILDKTRIKLETFNKNIDMKINAAEERIVAFEEKLIEESIYEKAQQKIFSGVA